jgi:predicted membrane-bound spermidine synthase
MNKVAERIARILGSAPVIISFGLWTIYHAVAIKDYVTSISDSAILIGLLILRAEIVASDRTEEISRADLAATKRIEKRLK